MNMKELEQADMDGFIICDKCGNRYELDGECYCGAKNPLMTLGMI